jgi:hypothetical protein
MQKAALTYDADINRLSFKGCLSQFEEGGLNVRKGNGFK